MTTNKSAPAPFLTCGVPFRHLDERGRAAAPSIRDTKTAPLVLIYRIRIGEDGPTTVEWANKPEDKAALLAIWMPERGDLLLWAWPGLYRTDVFELRPDDVAACWIK